MWSWFKHGHLDFDDGDSIAEGIGQGRITENVARAKIDSAFRCHDRHMITIVRHLINNEGLFLGASSGINVGGAVKVALEGGPGQTIVTILCDTAQKYMSRLFDQDWLTENDLPPEDLTDGLGTIAVVRHVLDNGEFEAELLGRPGHLPTDTK